MNGGLIALFGLLCLLTPMIDFIRYAIASGDDKADPATWLMEKSLQEIMTIRSMILGGIGLVWLGFGLWALRIFAG